MAYPIGLHTIDIDHLILDPLNPRLPQRLVNANERDVLNWMLSDATLTDLMASIVENSFFAGEALVGVNSGEYPGQIVVVEGNRRLASVKLLRNPSIADVKQKTVHELVTEGESRSSIPDRLPVYVVNNRAEVANYLGFRHVSGVKQWPVIAKARYLYTLFSTRAWMPDIYRQLAREIGSKSGYVRRLIVGYSLYLLISEHNFFDLDELNEENFDLSLINDAATKYAAIADYMGVNIDQVDPVENLHIEHFKNVYFWLYKRDEKGETRLGESRNLPVLNKVLSSETARNVFINDHYSLAEAAGMTNLADDNIRWHLQNARISMIEAQKLVHQIQAPNRSDVRLIDEIKSSADTIRREMAEKMLSHESGI